MLHETEFMTSQQYRQCRDELLCRNRHYTKHRPPLWADTQTLLKTRSLCHPSSLACMHNYVHACMMVTCRLAIYISSAWYMQLSESFSPRIGMLIQGSFLEMFCTVVYKISTHGPRQMHAEMPKVYF